MELKQNIIENSQDIFNLNEKIYLSQSIENLHYLYPNGHKITHQMRWYKGSFDRGFKN
tara:strand:+ start:471 stop:644 length:174 start_codon:yes stop_codon:yes gene_type:complete